MGLDATAFRNVDHVRVDYPGVAFEVDPETGEAEPSCGWLKLDTDWEAAIAKTSRIGNIDAVCKLRQQIERALPRDSVVLSQILFSGSHSGDRILEEQFGRLENELGALRDRSSDESVREFVSSLGALIDAARKERNPIVFT